MTSTTELVGKIIQPVTELGQKTLALQQQNKQQRKALEELIESLPDYETYQPLRVTKAVAKARKVLAAAKGGE